MTPEMYFDSALMLVGAVCMIFSVSYRVRPLEIWIRFSVAILGFILAMGGTLDLIDSYIEFATGIY